MKNLVCSIAFMLPLLFAFANPSVPEMTCPAPSNVHVAGSGSGYISFDWDDCGCFSTGFTVKYFRLSDGYTSPEINITNSNYTFSNLAAGNYKFYFRTNCGSETSTSIVTEDLVTG